MSSAEFSRRSRAGLVCSKKISVSYLIILLFLVSAVNVCASDLIKPLLASAAPQTLDMAPSRPLSQPGTSGPQFGGGSNVIPLSSDWVRDYLPQIPNLELGFLYTFGSNIRQTRWVADYVKPFEITRDNFIFAEAHAEYLNYQTTITLPFLDNFWNQGPPGAASRTDLSIGGGYRRMVGENLLLGVNGFYDTSRIVGSWYSAGGFGLQLAANGPGDSMVDLNANYYSNTFGNYDSRGSEFPTFNAIDSVKRGGGSYDVEAGYSQALFNREYDLRIKLAGYQFLVGDQFKPGLKTGAEITTRDGVWRVGIEYGHDAVSGQYGTIGGSLNIGFQAENILKGESPFGKPQPVFQSPRNLKRLVSQPVKRNWRKPESAVVNPKCYGLPDDSLFEVAENMACFYSGYPAAAGQCTGKGLYIISTTEGGILFNIYMAPYYADPVASNHTKDMDACASAAYARVAKGNIRVYIACYKWATKTGGFFETELPILMGNGEVDQLDAYIQDSGGGWPTTPTCYYKGTGTTRCSDVGGCPAP